MPLELGSSIGAVSARRNSGAASPPAGAGTAGGGAVKCVVNGHGEVVSLTISPDAASDDVEMLQDLITAAVNDGVHQVKAQIDAKTARITGGMKMPGMPGMIG